MQSDPHQAPQHQRERQTNTIKQPQNEQMEKDRKQSWL